LDSPGQNVARPQCQDEPAGECDQQLIACKAAHGFIDAAEAQHVDDQHGMLDVAADIFARGLDRLGKGEPVRKARESVVRGLVREQRLLLLAFGHVAVDAGVKVEGEHAGQSVDAAGDAGGGQQPRQEQAGDADRQARRDEVREHLVGLGRGSAGVAVVDVER